MAGEARIPFGPRLRNSMLPGNELRDLAPFLHWASTVCRRADNRHRAAESHHHDRPPDLHDYRLAIEEHIAVRDRVAARTDSLLIPPGSAHRLPQKSEVGMVSRSIRIRHLIACLLFLLASTSAFDADTLLPFDSRPLVEVHSLAAIPKDLISLLGWHQGGPDGIAARFAKSNVSGAAGSDLPHRRF